MFCSIDKFVVMIWLGMQADGSVASVPYFAVFDGHGGDACADWLSQNFFRYVSKRFDGGSISSPESAIADAFIAADKKILQPKKGLFGSMGERGIGGSKWCVKMIFLIF